MIEGKVSAFYTSKSFAGLCVVLFLVVYRKYGGYYYRSFMAAITLLIMAMYGFLSSIVFKIIGRTDLVNWSVALGYYLLGGFFCGLNVTAEGTENLYKVKGPVIYVCNHQSSLDIMFMGKVYPKNTAIVAKKALKYYPFLGWFSKFIKF
jgi:lysophosphatidate acyltransferase